MAAPPGRDARRVDRPGGEVLRLLLVNAVALAAFFVVVGAACIRRRDVTPVDAAWATGMVLLALTSALLGDGDPARTVLLTGLCAAWGVRLATHLLLRWRRDGPDGRYEVILGRAQERRGWSFARAAVLLVFLPQAPLLFVVSLPVQLGQVDRDPGLGPLALVGTVLAVFGILVESIGDLQLTRFRRDPGNAGRVLDTGLWHWTRHPNYFGDACTWWGLFLVAAETTAGRFSVVGPLLLTWTLTRWSGRPLLEAKLRRTRPDYVDYIARTPSFVPWFPRAPRAGTATDGREARS